MDFVADAFEKGGDYMYPILVVSIFVVGIAVERLVTLFFRAGIDRRSLVDTLDKLIRHNQIDRAAKLVQNSEAPLARVLRAGLNNYDKDAATIQLLMDEAALVEIPRVEARTGYLAMLSNVATLTGLLGTIVGLIHSFAAVASADAATKSTKLAEGISEAMNCTAFGLVVAVPALVLYAILTARQHKIVDDLNQATVAVYNIIRDAKAGITRPT